MAGNQSRNLVTTSSMHGVSVATSFMLHISQTSKGRCSGTRVFNLISYVKAKQHGIERRIVDNAASSSHCVFLAIVGCLPRMLTPRKTERELTLIHTSVARVSRRVAIKFINYQFYRYYQFMNITIYYQFININFFHKQMSYLTDVVIIQYP